MVSTALWHGNELCETDGDANNYLFSPAVEEHRGIRSKQAGVDLTVNVFSKLPFQIFAITWMLSK